MAGVDPMLPSPVETLGMWIKARAHLMLTKAPKERPRLLVAVFALGVVVLTMYALAYILHA